jgi:hypothetical protein
LVYESGVLAMGEQFQPHWHSEYDNIEADVLDIKDGRLRLIRQLHERPPEVITFDVEHQHSGGGDHLLHSAARRRARGCRGATGP